MADQVRQAGSAVLVAEGLQKSYGERRALRGLSFTLDSGRVLGFLGPNGAGKTTAIRILTTILPADAGWFTVAGSDSDDPAGVRRRIGVLPESLGFPRGTTAVDHLTFYGRMYGLSASSARARALALLEEVGLRGRATSSIGTYSRGMRQRLGIARALVNDPPVVFLDEPTLGLDPRGQTELLALVRKVVRDRGVAVVLCSHALDEVEDVCDDVVILHRGEVVVSAPVADVLGADHGDAPAGTVRRVRLPPRFADAALAALSAVPSVTSAAPIPERLGWLRVELDPERVARRADGGNNEVLEALLRAGVPVLGLEPEGGRLEDVFLQLTERSAT
jgi:ABC-2 type transport system ATP-binding protein